MYCKECGFQLPNDSKFCPNCGTKVEVNGIGNIEKKAVWGTIESVDVQSDKSSNYIDEKVKHSQTSCNKSGNSTTHQSTRGTPVNEKKKIIKRKLTNIPNINVGYWGYYGENGEFSPQWYEDDAGNKLSGEYDRVSDKINYSCAIVYKDRQYGCLNFQEKFQPIGPWGDEISINSCAHFTVIKILKDKLYKMVLLFPETQQRHTFSDIKNLTASKYYVKAENAYFTNYYFGLDNQLASFFLEDTCGKYLILRKQSGYNSGSLHKYIDGAQYPILCTENEIKKITLKNEMIDEISKLEKKWNTIQENINSFDKILYILVPFDILCIVLIFILSFTNGNQISIIVWIVFCIISTILCALFTHKRHECEIEQNLLIVKGKKLNKQVNTFSL